MAGATLDANVPALGMACTRKPEWCRQVKAGLCHASPSQSTSNGRAWPAASPSRLHRAQESVERHGEAGDMTHDGHGLAPTSHPHPERLDDKQIPQKHVPLTIVSGIEHGGDGFDLHKLIVVAEHCDAHQSAGDVVVTERVPDHLPGCHQVLPAG